MDLNAIFLLEAALLLTAAYFIHAASNYDSKACGSQADKKPYHPLSSNQHKILNGESVDMGELPYSVSITINGITGPTGDNRNSICSGTLISSRHVLTAAHCFAYFHKDKLKSCEFKTTNNNLLLESTFISIGGVCRSVDSAFNCSSKMSGHSNKAKRISMGQYVSLGCNEGRDLAVIELLEPVENTQQIPHICLLHRHNVDKLDNKKGPVFMASGYGADPSKNGYVEVGTSRLQKTILGYKIDQNTCNNIYYKNYGPSVPMGLMCTPEHKEKNVCGGDSGGGITTVNKSRMFLWSLVSFGTRCTDVQQGIFTGQFNTDLRAYAALLDDWMGERIEDRQAEWMKYES